MKSNLSTRDRQPTRCSTVAILTLLTVTGCFAEKPREQSAKDAAPSNATVRVTAGQPIKKTLRWFTEQPGRVEAFEETPIVSKIAGYVETVHCDLGDAVTRGQTLLRIRVPEYHDQLELKRGLLGQAEAQVKQAEAAWNAARAAAQSAKAMVAQAQAGIGRAEAEHNRWESEFQRIEQLASKGTVTSKLADETESRFQAAKSAKLEALAAIDSANARQIEAEAIVKTAEADIEAAQAKLQVAHADIQQAETMLTYTQLTCPFDGYVTQRNIDVGHYVQPAGANHVSPLLTIANVSKVRIFVHVPENEASWVDAGFDDSEKGDPVTLVVGSSSTQAIEARITRTSLQLDPQSHTLATEIDLENKELKLLPGAFITAKILLEERPDAMTLPTSAIVKLPSGTACCVVEDGKIQHRPIELGLRVGDDVQILSGLNGTETVVMMRANSLQPGQAVEILAAK